MAGGQGTRLRPLTSNQPKPMLPIVGKPMMQHVLRLARMHGVTEAVATVQFLASVIRNYFGDGSDLGLSLTYATEAEPLGTAGSVKNAEPLLDERFLVLSGDSMTDIDLSEVVRFHEKTGAAVTVTLKRVEDPLEFGIVIVDEDGRIERFLEKPGWGEVFSDTINTGIYVIEREVLDFIPEGREFDFSHDLFPRLLEKGLPMSGFVADGYWTDVGTLEAYQTAHRDVLDGKVDAEIGGFEVADGIWLGEDAELDPDAEVTGPLYIGENARVEAATIREYSVIGRSVVVKAGSFLHRAVVHDGAYVGPSTTLRGCVVGKNTDISFGSRLEEGVVVADECHVGEGAVINPQVKVYPFKTVEPGAIVSKSIIWQTGGARGLFGERGVSGLVNVDISPEMAVRLAMAYGSMVKKGSEVVVCRDGTRSARIIKGAMMAGINSCGVNVHDLEIVPIPAARFYARSARASGGVSVRTAPSDQTTVEIQFFDERGIDIDASTQRRLERTFYRDDLRRAFPHDFGDLAFPARGREYYVQGLLDAIDVDAIRGHGPKIVVDYAFGAATLTGPQVLARLGGDVLAVNSGLDEDRVVQSAADLAAHLDRLRRLVRSSGAELGALVDAAGERLRLVDGSGRVLDLRLALHAFVALVAETVPRPRVAVPVATSRLVADIVGRRGGDVVWTRISPAALMQASDEAGTVFAGAEGGGFIFPGFLPAYDAVMSLAKLLELLAKGGVRLQDVVDALPPVHVARREVPTPWEAKGTVMRRVLESVDGEGRADRVETIDGVKAYRGEDWALVVPHPQDPVVRLWAEAGSEREADALADEFAALVEEAKA